VSGKADDVVFRSRYVGGRCLVPGFLGANQPITVRILCALGALLGKTCGRRVPLFYGSDDQLEMLYEHRARFEEHFKLVLNDEAVAWALHDKGRFRALCLESGVPLPGTVVPADLSAVELPEALARLTPPLLVKPRTKSDWKVIQKALFADGAKAAVFDDAPRLLAHPRFWALARHLIVQEYIPGTVKDLASFHGFVADDGQLLSWFCGHKLRTFPATAGESALLELVRQPDLEAVGREVVERLGLRGPFKIDFIRHPTTGKLYVLEVNARYNLWHHLGAAHGVNLPLVAYQYLVDGTVPDRSPDYRPRLRWSNLYRDLLAIRARRPRATLRWLASMVVHRAVHEIFAWNDPLPFFAWLREMQRARRLGGRRWLRTV
jgi:predicted ATP-grasp superfamily ATP-dependent carboligase